jgi:hypothetical protein
MKGYSLHVGVDQLSKEYYDRPMNLECGRTDTELIHRLVKRSNIYIETKELIGQNATSINFFEELDKMIKTSTEQPHEEFYFFISATCHGDQINSDLGGEDGKIELLYFYDRLVLEFEIREKLVQFKSNAKVFLLLGSCNAGGIFHEKQIMNAFTESSIINKYEDYYSKLINKFTNVEFIYEASVFFMGAVGKNKAAKVGHTGKPSVFIENFLYVLKHPDFNSNYTHFTVQVKELSNRDRKPYTLIVGADPNFFENSKPVFFNEKITESNLKIIDMTWKITLMYDMESPFEMKAHIEYPNTHRYIDTIEADESPNHSLLYEYALDDYRTGDYIRIAQFKPTSSPGPTEVIIPLGVYKVSAPQLLHSVHVAATDTKNKEVKEYKKSHKEVNDEIGG